MHDGKNGTRCDEIDIGLTSLRVARLTARESEVATIAAEAHAFEETGAVLAEDLTAHATVVAAKKG